MREGTEYTGPALDLEIIGNPMTIHGNREIDFASRFPPRHLEASRLRGFEAWELRGFLTYE